jgi:hypothetical protein
MQDPIQLKNGALLTVSLAPFTDANRLLKAIARELAQVNFDLGDLDLKEISGKDINVLKNAVFQLLQSDAVETAVMKCAEKCLYNNERITSETFSKEDDRPAYLPVVWEVMKANLSPFFAGLNLSSLTSASPPTSGPK